MQANITIRKKDGGYQVVVSYKDGKKWRQKSKQGFETRRAAKEYGQDIIEELKEKTKDIKNQLLIPWKNLNIAETSDTVSIMTVEHKNKDIDLQQEFAKLKIRVISGSDFTGLDKNFIRFRMPEEKELPEVIKAFQIIDNIE